MPLKLNISGKVVCARLSGEIDHHSAKNMREEIDDKLYCCRPKTLAIDLGQTTFMDSSGLGLILGRAKTAGRLGANVRVVNADIKTIRLLKMAGCEKYVEIERVAL